MDFLGDLHVLDVMANTSIEAVRAQEYEMERGKRWSLLISDAIDRES